jgi:exopolysaccharide biosynthesis polyprenyl glycosylphosphotransferase
MNMNWGHPSRGSVELFLGDAALITLAAVVGWYLPGGQMSDGRHKLLSLLVMLPSFLAAMYVCNLYNLAGINGLGTFVKVIVAVGIAGAFCDGFFHLSRWKNATYYWSLGACTVVAPAVIYAWRRVYFRGARRMRTPEKLLVVGGARDAEILNAAMEHVHAGYIVLGMLRAEAIGPGAVQRRAEAAPPLPALTPAAVSVAAGGYAGGTAVAMAREPLEARGKAPPGGLVDIEAALAPASEKAKLVADLGPATCENLMRLVATRDVKVVVVRNEAMTSELAGLLTRLRFSGLQVYSLLDFCMRVSEEIPLEILNEFWLCVADGFDLLQARFFRRVKRLADLVLASVGLMLALPFMLLAAVAIRMDSAGPVLFRQKRVGWKGQPFELLKFRSMEVGAERNGGPQWAARDDPRVTAVGRILRKTHFDELPQMINILRGQMSFIGPRPERPEFVGILNESINFYHLRQFVLPGITGWAQVNYPYGASLEDARRKLQYDLYYVCNASPLLDLRTMLRTARVVLFQQGSR